VKRRLFVAGSASLLAGCSSIGTALNNNASVRNVLSTAEVLDHAVIRPGLAREYSEADIAPVFRVNGFATPSDATYESLVASRFSTYRLVVAGAVERPLTLSLADLSRFEQRTQITRHDCVEGWSVIGKWSGAPLGAVIDAARPSAGARYAVFHCMDRDDQGEPYYESLDLAQAQQPQTLLATSLNGAALDPDHGAPVRLRVPTQLGYKSAKWVKEIELVADFRRIAGGRGGYWEDQGYEWYAGI
jgi:DMSO/TMAO reductase YedYZ molybdopterin-dependent catalytic subunit